MGVSHRKAWLVTTKCDDRARTVRRSRMTVCTFCDREMNDNISCDIAPYRVGGELLQPIRWGDERSGSSFDTDHPCRGCGTPPGSVHHIGCDYEQCPACHGQINICPCVDDLSLIHISEPTRQA